MLGIGLGSVRFFLPQGPHRPVVPNSHVLQLFLPPPEQLPYALQVSDGPHTACVAQEGLELEEDR